MPKCTLCLKNEADKTGSHIIPHFLMKMVDNVDNSINRDQELGFKLTKTGVRIHFGRSVKPGKLEEVLGDVSDEDIENSRSEIIADFIYCSSCEKKFGLLESGYAPSVKKFDKIEEYPSTTDSFNAFLFWTSIIWRASACNLLGFKLSPKEENKLRLILDQNIGIQITKENEHLIKATLGNLQYQIIRCPEYSGTNSVLFFHHKHRFPYCFLLGEFVVFYYFKKTHQNNPEQVFFGFENKQTAAKFNNYASGEYILPTDDADFASCIANLTDFYAKLRTNQIVRLLDELHIRLGGHGNKMHPDVKGEIIAEIISDEKVLGRKYTDEDIAKSTFKILSKYNPVAND